MKSCPNCSYQNIEESLYCQECGFELPKIIKRLSNKTSKSKTKNSLYQKIKGNDLNDTIFIPEKKKSHIFRNLVIIVLIFFGLIFGLILLDSSNYLSESSINPTPTPVNINQLINQLDITDYDIKWIGDETYFTGTIRNKNYQHIKNVVIRIDFAWDKAMGKLFDTRYVTIEAVPSNGAFSFQLPVSVYQNKQYWYKYQIESANIY